MYGMWFLENGVVVFVKQTIMAMVIGSIIIVFLLFPQAVSDSAKEGLLMWFQIVLPSLLPFSIVSSVIMGLGLTERITGVVAPVLQRVFGITRSGCYAVVVGMLSGYPLGAATTAELYRGQRICKEEAQYILTFCNNASPMFLTEFIGVSCMGLHKPLIVLILVYIAGWIGSVIDRGGRHIMRSLGRENSWSAEFAGRKQEKPYAGNVINVLDESILHSFVILTKVGGYIILFSILAGIVQQMCPFAPEYKAGIVSALEITTGAVLLSSTIPGISGQVLLAAFCAFGGLSSVAQTASVISETDLSRHVAEQDLLTRSWITVAQLLVAEYIDLKHVAPHDQSGTAAHAVTHLRDARCNLLAQIVAAVAIVAPMVHVGHGIAAILVVSRDIYVGLARQGHTERTARIERTRTVVIPICDRRRTEILYQHRRLVRTRRNLILYIRLHGDRIGHVGYDGEFLRRLDHRHIILRHLHLLGHLRRRRHRQRRHQQYI